ncbi:DUF2971 domain-containing protein [Chryseobacterium aquaticum]|uniref:DUF2971 domain-containing protein n=1 Tax=Chryseobacterium aquaticum subsp. greenlandense TaxID=345663 RepID=A0A101CG69_9FLAO|nr:DUF2971 domain-containing protein [Chryseobacterium aquaticum]KUJ55624.1 hypothetical protein AR686_12500 [Chryseobacterium aquaticum subsp. greenlandense]
MLYKYRENSEYTDKIFTEQKVWLSNAKGLNDPFECTIQEIAEDYINKQVKIMKEAHLFGFIQSMKLSPDPSKTMVLKKIKKAINLDDKHAILQKAYLKYSRVKITNPIDTFKNFDKQLQNVGIFSLSEDPINDLMWAHYGEEHCGIAIGFSNTLETVLSNKEKCLKINYSDELPKFDSDGFLMETTVYSSGTNLQKITLNDPTFIKAITTKSKSWEYEKEWRYIEENAGTYPLPGKISEIIFGLRIENKMISKYRKLVKTLSNYSEIKFFKVEKVKNSNKLELKESTDFI